MSHIRIDKAKATKKWAPVLENMGVTGDRVEWMAEYAEFHSINENAYVNASNVAGLGAITNPTVATVPGQTIAGLNNTYSGVAGSGDVGQNLLPVAMKIAAQTIGLDLVAVKPSPGPKIDLLYIDFQYDDTRLGASDERPQVFKIYTSNAAVNTTINTALVAAGISQTTGGLSGGRLFLQQINVGTASSPNAFRQDEPTSKQNVVEFLGFSRVDGYPIFRAFRQANTAHTGVNQFSTAWGFDVTRNTFSATASMASQFSFVGSQATTAVDIQLVSALEDHIPGFSANWNNSSNTVNAAGSYPMSRDMDDDTYAGVIGPKISSKTIAVGTIEVSSALRRTEIEDIKANTGMDIVQKMESILVNELSQTISKQIVAKIFEMGSLNRNSAPLANGISTLGTTASTIFDLNTAYVSGLNGGGAIGGETTHAVQRKLITKIAHASNYIATEGRVGPAQYLITNGGLAAALQDIAGYTVNPVKSKLNGSGQLYPVGSIGDISIYVDPYMRYNDNRIVLGRKNNPDQPGIIFVPYLMAQSISVISEATFAPRMLLRSRYAVAEVGWFPQKQFMTLVITDGAQLLN